MYCIYHTYKKDEPKKGYVGMTNGNRPGYYGSGILIKRALKKYGKEAFINLILDRVESPEEACELERYYIRKLRTRETGYNIHPGGNNTYFHKDEVWNKGRE